MRTDELTRLVRRARELESKHELELTADDREELRRLGQEIEVEAP